MCQRDSSLLVTCAVDVSACELHNFKPFTTYNTELIHALAHNNWLTYSLIHWELDSVLDDDAWDSWRRTKILRRRRRVRSLLCTPFESIIRSAGDCGLFLQPQCLDHWGLQPRGQVLCDGQTVVLVISRVAHLLLLLLTCVERRKRRISRWMRQCSWVAIIIINLFFIPSSCAAPC